MGIKANLEVEKEERIVEAKKRLAAQSKARADAAAAAAKAKRDVANNMLKLIEEAQCKKHAGCSHLEGYCCPTLDFNPQASSHQCSWRSLVVLQWACRCSSWRRH